MNPTREERIQQRMRGSQRREVKDVDFGLTFPAFFPQSEPAAESQEIPHLPQPALSVLPSSLQEKRHTPTHQSITQPVKKTPEEEIKWSISRSGNNDANTSAKRKKLETDAPLSGRTTRSTRASPRSDVYDIPADELQDTSLADVTSSFPAEEESLFVTPEPDPAPNHSPALNRTTTMSPLPTHTPEEITEMVEITESPVDAPGSGYRTQIKSSVKAMSSQLDYLHNRSPSRSKTTTPVPRMKRKRGEIPQFPMEGKTEQENSTSTPVITDEDEIDELSPDQPRKRFREPKPLVEKASSDAEQEGEMNKSGDQDEEEIAEAISDLEAAEILKKSQSRRASQSFHTAESPDFDEGNPPQSISTKQRGRNQEPAKERRAKSSSKTKASKSKSHGKKSKTRSGSPIPVTVHRLTRRLDYDEDGSDADILNAEIPYAKRPGVNAIDVLGRVAKEVIGSGLATLEEGGNKTQDSSIRLEYKTKWRALRSFEEELQTRLLSHTINLDNAYSLDKRVREEQRRKLALRDEILRVRNDREKIALRMDEIRTKHECEAKKYQEHNYLNTAAHDIELAVEIGRANQSQKGGNVEMAGIEVLMKRVAGEVSNRGESGGILKQIKDFNSFLERAALALEKKKF